MSAEPLRPRQPAGARDDSAPNAEPNADPGDAPYAVPNGSPDGGHSGEFGGSGGGPSADTTAETTAGTPFDTSADVPVDTEPDGVSVAAVDEQTVPSELALGAVIAQRVREFRLRHGWTVGHLASLTGLSKGMLSKIENAQASPSLATLARLSESLAVPVTALFRGLAEEQDVLYIKAGTGLDIQHKGASPGHRYQLLGTMRAPHDTLEPLLVTLTERAEVFPQYQHSGTELIFMISGRMEYCYGSSRYLLEPGDTLQFVGEVMHGPGELITLPIQFLSVKSVMPAG